MSIKEVVVFGIGPSQEQLEFAEPLKKAGITVRWGLQFALPRNKDFDDWSIPSVREDHINRAVQRTLDRCPEIERNPYSYLDIEHEGFLLKTVTEGITRRESRVLRDMIATSRGIFPQAKQSIYNFPFILRKQRLTSTNFKAMNTSRKVLSQLGVAYPNFYPPSDEPEQTDFQNASWWVSKVLRALDWFRHKGAPQAEQVPMFWTGWHGELNEYYKWHLEAVRRYGIRRIAVWANLLTPANAHNQRERLLAVMPQIRNWAQD